MSHRIRPWHLFAVLALAAPQAALGGEAARGATPDARARKVERRAPTPEERKKLSDAMAPHLDQSDAGLNVEKRADGTETVHLRGRFQAVSVARKDGAKTAARCVTTEAEAKAFLEGAPKAGKEVR